MIPLTPSSLVAAATAFVGFGEGDARGHVVEHFLREVGQPPGHPWSAAFVHHVGYWSHYDHATGLSSWPLPATVSCRRLGEFAREHDLLETEPSGGDVFLLYVPEIGRFAHTGVVVAVPQSIASAGDQVYVCTTVEGNTSYDGTRDGRLTLQATRRFSVRNGDRFIRWTRAEQRSEAAAAPVRRMSRRADPVSRVATAE